MNKNTQRLLDKIEAKDQQIDQQAETIDLLRRRVDTLERQMKRLTK